MPTPTRSVDLAVAPRCRTCGAALPRIVSDGTNTVTTMELKCSACGTGTTFSGPGLILDRRQGQPGNVASSEFQ